MKRQLFFDDNLLFGRDNVVRHYGTPEKVASYSDGVCSTDYNTGQVFRLADGRWRLLYFAHSLYFKGKKLFAAISEDGIHFSPEQLWEDPSAVGKQYAHEVMDLPRDSEIATIFEDTHCDDTTKKYKMLMAEFFPEELTCVDTVYTSGDLLHWEKQENWRWGRGTEPLAGAFYNEHQQVYTIVLRPFWGIRRAGLCETTDWEHLSEYRVCLNVDALDEPLSEIYGMIPFAYEGMYIGLPHMYRGLHSQHSAKFKDGTIDTQLAYSYDGRYWSRSLREPFITGLAPQGDEPCYPLTWIGSVKQAPDGSVLFYGSASTLEHGMGAFVDNTGINGRIFVYRLRQDGFIALSTEDAARPATVITREKVWHGGELHLNLVAQEATVAVYSSNETENVGSNALGVAEPVPGYSHDDCVPFSGDATDWIPTYQNGKKLNDLVGGVLVFEVRFKDGTLYSLAGDYTDVFNTEGARYRKFGILPNV